MDVLARIRAVSPEMAAAAKGKRDAEGWAGGGGGGGGGGKRGGKRRNTALESGATVFERENGRVIIVADEGTKGLVETRDPHDGAHLRRDPLGRLVSSAVRPKRGRPGRNTALESSATKILAPYAKARKYPPSHMGTSGVALDSSFDAAHERAQWLKRELGVDLVGGCMADAVGSAAATFESLGGRLYEVLTMRSHRARNPMKFVPKSR